MSSRRLLACTTTAWIVYAQECEDILVPGDDPECYGNVTWAMNVGIIQHPDWYANFTGLSEHSSRLDFQCVLYHMLGPAQAGRGWNCTRPCSSTLDVCQPPTPAPSMPLPTTLAPLSSGPSIGSTTVPAMAQPSQPPIIFPDASVAMDTGVPTTAIPSTTSTLAPSVVGDPSLSPAGPNSTSTQAASGPGPHASPRTNTSTTASQYQFAITDEQRGALPTHAPLTTSILQTSSAVRSQTATDAPTIASVTVPSPTSPPLLPSATTHVAISPPVPSVPTTSPEARSSVPLWIGPIAGLFLLGGTTAFIFAKSDVITPRLGRRNTRGFRQLQSFLDDPPSSPRAPDDLTSAPPPWFQPPPTGHSFDPAQAALSPMAMPFAAPVQPPLVSPQLERHFTMQPPPSVASFANQPPARTPFPSLQSPYQAQLSPAGPYVQTPTVWHGDAQPMIW